MTKKETWNDRLIMRIFHMSEDDYREYRKFCEEEDRKENIKKV